MSPATKIVLFLVVLMVLVFVVYVSVVRAYYWWGRGAPPPTGEERRKLKEEELRLRAKQIEYAKKNPRVTRKSSFWDNSKVHKEEGEKRF
jgi:hypothetical protein